MGDDPLIGFCTASVRFERLLGRGAMGAVYCGVQLSLQRAVAIKVIASHLTEDPAYLARFEREAHTLGRLVHPHVIACHDFGPSPGPDGKPIYLMVMEFVDGWSLGWLAKNKRVTVRSVLELHRQAAEGLAAAHALGIIHRDIKPDNILVTRDGQAKLADFGLARELERDSELTAAGSILGSPGFMSPETCRGLEPTAASDIYSLGCSMAQVLTGTPVYVNSSALAVMQMHISEPILRLADRRPELASLQDIVDRCLAKEPAERYPSAKELARELALRIQSFSRALLAGKQIQGGASTAAGGSSRLPMASVNLAATARAPSPGSATITTSLPAQRVGANRRARALAIIACVLVPAVLAVVLANRGSSATHVGAAVHALGDPAPGQAPTREPSGPASAASPKPGAAAPHAIDPDAADREQLARIEAMIGRNDLDQAEAALADLVVTGELKQGKKALLERVDAARIAQGAAISAELDTARTLLLADPAAAAVRLRALSIPDHFSDLDDARQQLIAQAEHAPRASGPSPMPAAAPAAQATHFMARGDGRLLKFGSAELPGPQPYGGSIFLASLEHVSERSGDVAYLSIHLPAGSDKDGLLALVRSKGAARLYTKEMVEGTREGGAQLTYALGGKDWELIRVPLSLSTAAPRVVHLVMRFADGPFYFAGAVVGGNGMPNWDHLRMVPGTLTSGGEVDVHLAALRERLHALPTFANVRLALPVSLRGGAHAHELLARLMAACAIDCSKAWPSGADSHEAFYASDNERYAITDQLGEARATPGIAIAMHWLSTAHPPTLRASDIAQALNAALRDEHHPLLPVLVLSNEAVTAEAHIPWATFARQLRELVPGLPIIDLNLAALDLKRLGSALVPQSPDWLAACDLAFQGGFAELLARMRAN